jgi:class 3 adenylate cyclase
VNQLLSTIGLRFSDKTQEAEFRREFTAAALPRQRVLATLGLIIFLVYAIRDVALGSAAGYAPLYFRVFFVLPMLAFGLAMSYRANAREAYHTLFTALLIAVIAAVGILSLLYPHYAPTDPSQANRTMSTVLLVFGVMTLSGLRFTHAMLVGLIAIVFWLFISYSKALDPTLYPTYLLNVITAFVMASFAVYWLERAERRAFAARIRITAAEAAAEAAKREDLPATVSERLKSSNEPIADAFIDAAVVMMDLAGFTDISRRVGAVGTVRILNRIFAGLDEIAVKYNLERINTVGDSCLLIGGTHTGSGDIEAAINAAHDALMLAETVSKEVNLPITFRIAAHIGPLIGGVIGGDHPRYEYWGDTIAIAAALETNGQAGRIHCSETVYWRTSRTWRYTAMGTLEIPGFSTMQTYYLIGPALAREGETHEV